jgi:hypothetical protein
MNGPAPGATAGLRTGALGYVDITSMRPPVGAVTPNRNDPAVQEALAGAAALRQPDQPLRVVPVEGGHALADTDSYLRWWALRNTGSGIGQVRPEHVHVVSGNGTAVPAAPDPLASPVAPATSPGRTPPRPGGATVTPLPLSAITVDPGLQTRASMNPETVAEYAEALTAGIRLPPVVVYRDDDGALLLADGFHRVAAAERAGLSEIDAVTHEGGRRAALLHAVGANARHGLRRTNADKRRCVELLLRDREWREWSDVLVAQQCGVSDKTVAAVRGALVSTSEVPECPIRKTADGRKMRTGRIGRQPSPAQSAGRTGLRHRATGDRANPDQDPEAAATPAPSADFRAELAPDSPHDSTGQPEFSSTTPRSVNGRWQSLDEAAAKVLIHLVAFAATDPNGAACWRDEHFDAVTAAISVKGAQGGSIGRLRMHPPR